MKTQTAYLSLGTNLGNRENNLHKACALLESEVGQIISKSSIIETDPVDFDSDNKFLNMCIAIETVLLPMQLLDVTQNIERQMGRTQKSVNGVHHDRIIDIDILLYGDINLKTQRLTIPHPKMLDRDFVIIPLREIMKDL